MPTNQNETEQQQAQDELPADRPRFGPFKVLSGRYVGNDPDDFMRDAMGGLLKDPLGNPIPKEIVKDTGSPPFYATTDLLQYNYPGMGPKFALVGAEPQFTTMRGTMNPTPPRMDAQQQMNDGLEELTVQELRGVASDEEISLEGVSHRKADIITAIRNSRANQQQTNE